MNEGRVVRSSWRLWIQQWMRGGEEEEQGVELVSGQWPVLRHFFWEARSQAVARLADSNASQQIIL